MPTKTDLFGALRQEISKRKIAQKILAESTGVSQSAISRFMNGQQGLDVANLLSILNFLGGEVSFPDPFDKTEKPSVIRRLGTYSPEEAVQGDDLRQMPVYGNVGAGNAVEFFAAEPESFIKVLPQYAIKNGVALVVDGDSMEPLIPKGSIVGIAPLDGQFHEGGVYLVDLPPFGRVIKRIKMATNGLIMLYSDNPNYEPVPLLNEGYDNIIGRVDWVMKHI